MCEHFCRLLEHMDACGSDTVVPELDGSMLEKELISRASDQYVKRSVGEGPRQGSYGP